MTSRPTCTGEGAFVESKGGIDHCCYQNGVRCVHLVENVGGRRYACGLRHTLGSWKAVNESSEYQAVGDFWLSIGQVFNYCETFDPAFCCRPEYRNGRDNEKVSV